LATGELKTAMSAIMGAKFTNQKMPLCVLLRVEFRGKAVRKTHFVHRKRGVSETLTFVYLDIKFIAVGRALNRDIVASYAVSKNDTAEQYHTAVRSYHFGVQKSRQHDTNGR
jgi:hypothetical protein